MGWKRLPFLFYFSPHLVVGFLESRLYFKTRDSSGLSDVLHTRGGSPVFGKFAPEDERRRTRRRRRRRRRKRRRKTPSTLFFSSFFHHPFHFEKGPGRIFEDTFFKKKRGGGKEDGWRKENKKKRYTTTIPLSTPCFQRSPNTGTYVQ